MATVPVDDAHRSEAQAEGWAIRIEQLHAEIDRLQQALPVAGQAERPDGDPMFHRGDEVRRVDERIAMLEQERQDLLARVGELETECERLRAHITAIEATRLMRWSRVPRQAYRVLRERGRTD